MQPWLAKFITSLPDFIFQPIGVRLLNGTLDKYADIKVSGLDEIKKIQGPIIFIGNHLSNSDGLVLDRVLRKDFNPSFIAGVKLSGDPMTNIGMRLIKTINIKPNSADKDALKNIIQASKNGENILMFPEGTRSRTGEMIEAKKGINLIARLTKATIVPFSVYGSENLMPINKEGNMGSEKFVHATVHVTFGSPVIIPKKEKDEDRHSYDDKVLETYMKSIASLLPEKYRGFYK
ncbi:MAG: lysophospholipid acyltransferase family protein [Sarcina sp.]